MILKLFNRIYQASIDLQKRKWDKSMMKTLFSIIFVVVLMFSGLYIVYNIFMNDIDKQIYARESLERTKTVESFNNYFNQTNNIFNTIDLLSKGNSGYISRLEAYELENKLANIVATNEFIDEIVVCNNDNDIVVTSLGTATFHDFFNKHYLSDTYNLDYWTSLVNDIHPVTVIPASEYTQLHGNQNVIEKKWLIGFASSNQLSDANINSIIFIDVKKLLVLTGYNNLNKDNFLTVLDKNRKVVLTTESQTITADIKEKYENIQSEVGTIDGKEGYYSMNSSYNKLLYLIKIPKHQDLHNKTFIFARIILILSLILGIFTAISLTIYLFKPVRKILAILGIDYNDSSDDAFSKISIKIGDILDENKKFESKFEPILIEANKSRLLKSIKGMYSTNNDDQVELIKEIFSYNHYVMASVFFYLSPQSNSDTVTVTSNIHIFEILQNCFSQYFHNVDMLFEGSEYYIAVIGTEELLDRNEVLKNAEQIINDLKQTELVNYNFFIGVSNVYSDLHDYNNAYIDIKMCKLYRNMLLSEGVIDLNKIDFEIAVDTYFPQNMKDRLISFIVNGKFNECYNMIEEILTTNAKKGISYVKYIDVLRIVFDQFIQAIIFCGINKTLITDMEKMFYENIENCMTVEASKKIFKRLINIAEENNKIPLIQKLDKSMILNYIGMHYMEDLYLDKMAEIMGTTPKYFSKYFKKEFNVNFIEYLNRTRIFHAKILLRNENLSISEIAVKVGIPSSNTFTSTFKKLEGMSPSEYREVANQQISNIK